MRVPLTTLALAIALAASGTVSAQPVGSPAILLSKQNYNLWIYDVQYRRAGADSWLVRIYEPQGTGPFPLLLDVHGGVWGKLDRTLNEVIDHALAASGMVVAAIDFRQAPLDPYPASVADINYATRWLKVHGRDFNADPQTIGGPGKSSRGHLVTPSAMGPQGPPSRGLPPNLASPGHAPRCC